LISDEWRLIVIYKCSWESVSCHIHKDIDCINAWSWITFTFYLMADNPSKIKTKSIIYTCSCKFSVPYLLIGLTGWSLGPQHLEGYSQRVYYFWHCHYTFIHTCMLSEGIVFLKQPFSNFPCTVALRSESCRILNTPHHCRLNSNWLSNLPSSSSRESVEFGMAL
jgi:hypothetical protein